MVERVSLARILPTQDSLPMKALGRAAGDGRGSSWQRLSSPGSLLSALLADEFTKDINLCPGLMVE